jgi:hypothetical protein
MNIDPNCDSNNEQLQYYIHYVITNNFLKAKSGYIQGMLETKKF